ncbi:hypothetical protein MBLNU459_g0043t1 [Dothideomycetes sp. NU459]
MSQTNGRQATLEMRNGAPKHSATTNGAHSSSDEHDSPVRASASSHARPAHSRKASSPLAPPFMVSAPGKVIVYGEHAVVHGKAAIAAAISLRSYLLVTTLSKSRRTITLNFRDIALNHTWDIDALPWAAFSHPSRKKRYYDLVTSLDPELVAAMQPHISSISPDTPEPVRKTLHAAASAFLYLFLSLGSQNSPGGIYTLRSTIPIGAGLGSSASTSVCLATALLIQCRALSGPHPDQLGEEAEKQIERINRWAFVGEMLIHGNPSGVDNTVSSGGKAVLFKRTDYAKPPLVKALRNFPELPLVLVDTRQSRSTAAEVAKVARLRKTHPAIADTILDAIDHITESAHNLIESGEFDASDPASLVKLGELTSMNHGLLVSLGVSHPRLERLRQLVDESGVGWSKLTGAGGGGCAFVLLKPNVLYTGEETPVAQKKPNRVDALRRLEQGLETEGFDKYETTLGGDGVGVLWPAVLHNGSDEVGGEEIEEDKFVAAEGREGVEQLVGVRGGDQGAVREGWKFWRI